MPYFHLLTAGLVCAAMTCSAFGSTSCENGCFDRKQACARTADNFITMQRCDSAMIACRMSCQTGKQANKYKDLGGMEYSFHPVLQNVM